MQMPSHQVKATQHWLQPWAAYISLLHESLAKGTSVGFLPLLLMLHSEFGAAEGLSWPSCRNRKHLFTTV